MRIWDAATGALVRKLEGHTRPLWDAAFSRDGLRVVTASGDNTARVWSAPAGDPIARLEGHTGLEWSAAFSPDGNRIVTASDDGTARVFRLVRE